MGALTVITTVVRGSSLLLVQYGLTQSEGLLGGGFEGYIFTKQQTDGSPSPRLNYNSGTGYLKN